MPKVYFRTADSKAFSKDIEDEVNYNQILDAVVNKFKVASNNIQLTYNGEIRTGNFKLNKEIPHHIVHIADKSSASKQKVNVSLTVNAGKKAFKIKDVPVKPNITVDQFVHQIMQTQNVDKNKADSNIKVLAGNKEMQKHETFENISDNENINITLGGPLPNGQWPDPADIPLCAQLLADSTTPIVMAIAMTPKFFPLGPQIQAIQNAGVFRFFQQSYEGQRVNIIYSDFDAYRFPNDPGEEGSE